MKTTDELKKTPFTITNVSNKTASIEIWYPLDNNVTNWLRITKDSEEAKEGKYMDWEMLEPEKNIIITLEPGQEAFFHGYITPKVVRHYDEEDELISKEVSTISFYFAEKCKLSGNILTMVNSNEGDSYDRYTWLNDYNKAFSGGYKFINQYKFFDTFSECNVVDVHELVLPTSNLTDNCYERMFINTPLDHIPIMPAPFSEHKIWNYGICYGKDALKDFIDYNKLDKNQKNRLDYFNDCIENNRIRVERLNREHEDFMNGI